MITCRLLPVTATALNEKFPTIATIEYLLVYPDLRKNEAETSGGYVEMHITHASHEAAKNIETATCLAKLGFKIRLLPVDNTPNKKNPDAFLIEENVVVEFKHNYTPTASAIEREVCNCPYPVL